MSEFMLIRLHWQLLHKCLCPLLLCSLERESYPFAWITYSKEYGWHIRSTLSWNTCVEPFGLLIIYSVPFYMSLNKNHPSHLAALPPSISDSKCAYPHNYLYYTIISLLEQCDLHSAEMDASSFQLLDELIMLVLPCWKYVCERPQFQCPL